MTNQDHVFNILDDVLLLLSGQGFPTPERTYKLDGGWGLALSDLRRCFDRHRTRIAELEAERDAARAGEARAVEALRKLHSAASYVAEECNEDDWTVDQQAMLNLHEALDAVDVEEPQPALDWLDQRERKAVEAERWDNTDVVRTMGPHFCDFFFGGPGAADFLQQQLAAAMATGERRAAAGTGPGRRWTDCLAGDFNQRIAALTKQQPAACFRSEVRGVENNNA
jgi:hypothetical protein